DVGDPTRSAFKRVEVRQVTKSRRNPSEPHNLSAARAARRRLYGLVGALVQHGQAVLKPQCASDPGRDVVNRADQGLRLWDNPLFGCATKPKYLTSLGRRLRPADGAFKLTASVCRLGIPGFATPYCVIQSPNQSQSGDGLMKRNVFALFAAVTV